MLNSIDHEKALLRITAWSSPCEGHLTIHNLTVQQFNCPAAPRFISRTVQHNYVPNNPTVQQSYCLAVQLSSSSTFQQSNCPTDQLFKSLKFQQFNCPVVQMSSSSAVQQFNCPAVQWSSSSTAQKFNFPVFLLSIVQQSNCPQSHGSAVERSNCPAVQLSSPVCLFSCLVASCLDVQLSSCTAVFSLPSSHCKSSCHLSLF